MHHKFIYSKISFRLLHGKRTAHIECEINIFTFKTPIMPWKKELLSPYNEDFFFTRFHILMWSHYIFHIKIWKIKMRFLKFSLYIENRIKKKMKSITSYFCFLDLLFSLNSGKILLNLKITWVTCFKFNNQWTFKKIWLSAHIKSRLYVYIKYIAYY